MQTGIKTYEELSIAASLDRTSKEVRIWHVLRHLNTATASGSGWVRLSDLIAYVTTHDICSYETLRRTLNGGDGQYWTRERRGYVKHKSLHDVAAMLGVDLRRRPVYLPISDYRTIGAFRAAVVRAFFVDKPRTMSRMTLSTLTGRTPRTLQRYTSRGCTVTKNAMVSPRPCTDTLDPELAERGYYRSQVGETWRLLRRLPNTYDATGRHELAAYGMVKHKRRRSFLHEAKPQRLYFDDASAAARALQARAEGEPVYLRGWEDEQHKPHKTDFWGMQLWTSQQVINGQVLGAVAG